MRSDQQNPFPVLNQGLFSQNYLDKKLPDSSVWRDAPGLSERTTKAMAAIRSAYKGAKRADVFDARDEQKTEDKFIRPVLKALGWLYDPQPRHRRRTKKVRPDYALFADQEEYENAGRTPDEPKAYYLRAQVVAEAKYRSRDDPLDARDATAQLVRYLDEVYYHTDGKLAWGILTDGKTWRLFSHRAASRSCNYYEVDLEGLLHTDEPSAALQEIQFHSWFAFDTDGYYLNNKAFFVPSGDRYLLALLNSSVTWWFL